MVEKSPSSARTALEVLQNESKKKSSVESSSKTKTQKYSKLHQQIVAFQNATDTMCLRRESAKAEALHRVKNVVRLLWPRALVLLYGSYVSGLSLPSSDIDVVINLPRILSAVLSTSTMLYVPVFEREARVQYKKLYQLFLGHILKIHIQNNTGTCNLAADVGATSRTKQVGSESGDVGSFLSLSHQQPSRTTTTTNRYGNPMGQAVAIIRIVTKPLGRKFSNQQEGYRVNLDLSLQADRHNGVASSGMVLSLSSEHRTLRPLLLVLKQLLLRRGLQTSHTGGLCSYGLVLMLARFLQEQEPASWKAVGTQKRISEISCYAFFDSSEWISILARRVFP